MADKTGITWAHSTWNPIVGCSIHSPGCTHCYAMREAHRLGLNPSLSASKDGNKYAGLTHVVNGNAVWNGNLRLWEPHLDQPLRWTKPRLIFANSMSDLFHEKLFWGIIDKVMAVISLAGMHGHIVQVLTKRADVMEAYMNDPKTPDRIDEQMNALAPQHWHRRELQDFGGWPIPHLWMGVSTERQKELDERLPHLKRTAAAVRWVSAEPLLESLDFAGWMDIIDWMVVGGESHRDRMKARPMAPAWEMSIRQQCEMDDVAYFFKQWGEWAPAQHVVTSRDAPNTNKLLMPVAGAMMECVGKKVAGDLVNGVRYHAWPKAIETLGKGYAA